MAFFRKVFDEVAQSHKDIETERLYVDACALDLVRRPWEFDVLVTENMFGDILSDLAAGLVGGMGFAPSADIGHSRAVFQPAHGSAYIVTREERILSLQQHWYGMCQLLCVHRHRRALYNREDSTQSESLAFQ